MYEQKGPHQREFFTIKIVDLLNVRQNSSHQRQFLTNKGVAHRKEFFTKRAPSRKERHVLEILINWREFVVEATKHTG